MAVNFWVRSSADGLDADGIKAAAGGLHPEWDVKTPGIRTDFARQLELFASEIESGDDIVTFDAAARDVMLIGKVRDAYRYEATATIPDHPHVRSVEWLGTVDRAGLPDAGASVKFVRGVTVRRLWDARSNCQSARRRADPCGRVVPTAVGGSNSA